MDFEGHMICCLKHLSPAVHKDTVGRVDHKFQRSLMKLARGNGEVPWGINFSRFLAEFHSIFMLSKL